MATFSKSKITRFNEIKESTPAPGAYDPKLPGGSAGPATFIKSQRFVEPKFKTPGPVYTPSQDRFRGPAGFNTPSSSRGLVESSPALNVLDGSFIELNGAGALNRRKSDPSEELARLRDINRELSHQVYSLRLEVESLQEQRSQVEEMFVCEKGRLQNLLGKQREVKAASKVLTTDVLNLKSITDHSMDKIKAAVIEINSKVEVKEKELLAQVEDLRTQNANLSTMVQRTQDTLTEQAERIWELQTNEAELKEQVEKGLAREATLVTESDLLQSCIFKLEDSVSTLKEERALLQERLEALQADINLMTINLSISEQKGQSQQVELEELRKAAHQLEHALQEKQELQQALTQKEEVVCQLQAQYNNTTIHSQDLEAEVTDLKIMTDRLQSDIQMAFSERDDAWFEAREASESLRNTQNEVKDLTHNLECCEAQLERLQEENGELVATSLETDASRVELQQEVEDLTLQLEQVKLDSNALKEEVEESTALVDHLQEENKTLHGLCKDLNHVVDKLRLERDDATSKEKVLKSERDAARADLELVRGEHEECREHADQLRASLELKMNELEAENRLLQHENSHLSSKLESLQSDMEQQKGQHVAELRAQLESVIKENKELRLQHLDLRLQASKAEDRASEMTTEMGAARNRVQEAIRQAKEADACFQAVSQQNLNMKEEIASLSQRLAEVLGHQNLRQKIRHVVDLKNERVEMQERIRELEAQNSFLHCQLQSVGMQLAPPVPLGPPCTPGGANGSAKRGQQRPRHHSAAGGTSGKENFAPKAK